MVAARKAVIFLGGDAEAAKKVEPVIKGFSDMCVYFGPFGAATKVKLVNNLLVAINIAATAEAMALGLKTGVDKDLLIKAVATGSGEGLRRDEGRANPDAGGDDDTTEAAFAHCSAAIASSSARRIKAVEVAPGSWCPMLRSPR